MLAQFLKVWYTDADKIARIRVDGVIYWKREGCKR